MQAILIYLLKVVGCSAIFVFYYRFFLRNKHFHYYNRFFLLFAVGASIVLPLIQLSWFSMQSHNAELLALMQLYSGQYASAVIVTGEKAALDWDAIGQYLLACSILLLLFPILRNIFSVKKLRKQYPQVKMNHFTLIETNLRQAPFSFFQDLFWRQDIDMSSPVGQQILQHELTHIQQKHSWDKMFLQTACAVFWANPFFWHIKKEMSMIHEFIADEHALQGRDASDFAAMLLQAQFGQTYLSGINPFALSPIKRRLHMITHSKKPKYSYLRRLMALPLLAVITMLLAFRYQEKKEEKAVADLKQTITLSQKADIDTPPAQAKPFIVIDKKRKDSTNTITVIGHRSAVSVDSLFKKSLIIIDGKMATVEMRKNIDPEQIHSFTVLKDKAATAIYGDGAKDGVIIIESKKATHADNAHPLTGQLQGKITGIHITSGEKSSTRDIWVRGYPASTDSFAKRKEPLMILNGSIIDNDILKTISPNDIESVSVLQDKTATEKYGDKGKNGVIEIKTKGEYKEITVVGYAKPKDEKQATEASYPGGRSAFIKYLELNLRNAIPIDNKAPAGLYTLKVLFTVLPNGTLANIKALNDPGYGTASEAIRVIKHSGKWIPAEKNGEKISSKLTQKISFQVSK